MNLKQELEVLNLQPHVQKVQFFEYIGESIPIAVRMIIGREELDAMQKVEALRLISEFHHEMNKIKKHVRRNEDYFDHQSLLTYIVFMAKQKESLLSSEVTLCLQEAFRMIR